VDEVARVHREQCQMKWEQHEAPIVLWLLAVVLLWDARLVLVLLAEVVASMNSMGQHWPADTVQVLDCEEHVEAQTFLP
jgi:hypothetical protein